MPEQSITFDKRKLLIYGGVACAVLFVGFVLFVATLFAGYKFLIEPKLGGGAKPNAPVVAVDLQQKVLAAFSDGNQAGAKADAHDATCFITELSQRIAYDGQRDATKRRFITSSQIEDFRLVFKDEFQAGNWGQSYPQLAVIFGDHAIKLPPAKPCQVVLIKGAKVEEIADDGLQLSEADAGAWMDRFNRSMRRTPWRAAIVRADSLAARLPNVGRAGELT